MFRMMLCKLNSSTDIVTQDCFDQEILKISSINSTRAVNYDYYNIRVAPSDIEGNLVGPNFMLDPGLELSIK